MRRQLKDTLGRRNRLLSDRRCETCGSVFRPIKSHSRFCTKGCCDKWFKATRQVEVTLESLLERTEPVPGCGCMLWTGCPGKNGYGQIKIRQKPHATHRLSWELSNKRPIPEGLVVMHKCDTPACINPDHLSVGTQAQNIADRYAKRRLKAEEMKTEDSKK